MLPVMFFGHIDRLSTLLHALAYMYTRSTSKINFLSFSQYTGNLSFNWKYYKISLFLKLFFLAILLVEACIHIIYRKNSKKKPLQPYSLYDLYPPRWHWPLINSPCKSSISDYTLSNHIQFSSVIWLVWRFELALWNTTGKKMSPMPVVTLITNNTCNVIHVVSQHLHVFIFVQIDEPLGNKAVSCMDIGNGSNSADTQVSSYDNDST